MASNINQVVLQIKTIIDQKLDPDKYLRELSTNRLADIKRRVHEDGIATDGSKIGTYSAEYMKRRTNTGFKSSVVVRGDDKGQKRTPTNGKGFNRTQDTDVVISLTRELELSLAVIPTPLNYKVAYLLPLTDNNRSKVKLMEEKYNKKIWQLTEQELEANKEDILYILANG